MRTLLPFFRPEGPRLLLALLLGLVALGAGLGLQGTGAYLVSAAALRPATILLLVVPIAGMRFFSLLRASARYGERLLAHDVTFGLLSGLKVRIYETLARSTPAALWQRSSGEWLRQLSADVDRLQGLYVDGIGPLLVLCLGAVLAFSALSPFGLAVAATAGSSLLLTGLGLPLLALLLQRRSRARLASVEQGVARGLVESVEGMADLLMTPNGGLVRAGLLAGAREAGRRRLSLDRMSALLQALTVLSAHATGLLLLWEASLRVRAALMPPVDTAVVALLAVASFEAVSSLARAVPILADDLETSTRLLIKTPPLPSAAKAGPPRDFSISARGLGFRYGTDAPWIFEDISFALPQGRHVLLTGSSGAGKSTLLYLLAGLLEEVRGDVRVGGIRLRDLPEETLHRIVATVPQRPHLFDATLEENLRVARPEADRGAVAAAVERAALAPVVASLPFGLQTPVGGQGFALSGGERQRVALARLFLADAPVLLLDEPWDGLDSGTRRKLLSNLQSYARGRSLLLVSHEDEPLWRPDEVWRLEDGRLTIAPPEAGG